jgi:hypothetical protein
MVCKIVICLLVFLDSGFYTHGRRQSEAVLFCRQALAGLNASMVHGFSLKIQEVGIQGQIEREHAPLQG